MYKWLLAILPVAMLSCGVKDYNNLPLYTENHRINAVVEIPAGTSHSVEYCGLTHRFNLKSPGQSGEVLEFLPYPFNFGFIPSTATGDNDASTSEPMNVIILAESMPTGAVMEVLPVALVNVVYEFGSSLHVIAIPYEEQKRIIDAGNLEELNSRYPGAVRIIEEWLCFSDSGRITQNLVWEDELMAVKVIEKYSK